MWHTKYFYKYHKLHHEFNVSFCILFHYVGIPEFVFQIYSPLFIGKKQHRVILISHYLAKHAYNSHPKILAKVKKCNV